VIWVGLGQSTGEQPDRQFSLEYLTTIRVIVGAAKTVNLCSIMRQSVTN
jgi:hypothetical protein